MIIKAQCEHCQSVFEDEGLEKTVWCPSCGKETHIYAKGSDYSFKPNAETTNFDGIIALGCLLAVLLPAVGFFVGVYLLFKKPAWTRRGSNGDERSVWGDLVADFSPFVLNRALLPFLFSPAPYF